MDRMRGIFFLAIVALGLLATALAAGAPYATP